MASARSLQPYRYAPPALAAGPTYSGDRRSSGVLDVLRTYRRHLPTFFIVAGTIFGLFALYTFLQTPRFTATATVVIAPRPSDIGTDRTTPLGDPSSDSSIDTQVEVIKSAAITGMVVDRLGLAQPDRFKHLTETPSLFSGITAGLAANDEKTVTTDASRREAAIQQLDQGLDVRRTGQTFALELSYTHPDRVLAQRIANSFATVYIEQSLATKRDAAQTGSGLLRNQLAAARAEVQKSEDALGRYQVAHNLMSVNGYTVAEQQLATMEGQVATARADAAEANARLATARHQIAGGSTGDDLGETLGSPTIQQLRSQRVDLSSRVADLSGRFGDRYPPLAAAKRQLQDIDSQIQGEINRTVASLASSRDAAAQREASLAASAAAIKGSVAQNNMASVGMNGLQLRAQTARDAYTQLLNRISEISTQASTMQADARIVSLAPVPRFASAPNVPISLLVGLLVGISGGILAVFLRQGTDTGLRTLEDVETRIHLPYLAGLPTVASSIRNARGSGPVQALLDHGASAFAEGYRSLGASILDSHGDTPVRTIALTSALPNEGKTTAAIGLVRTLALRGMSVVLVDADLRHPSIADALGLTAQTGLQQVIQGTATLDEALLLDAESGASILPMLRTDKSGTSSLLNEGFDALVEALKQRFDVVVFDASPVLPVVDGRLVAKKADATVLLVRWRKTSESAVEMAVHLLEMLGVNLIGVALTRVDLQEMARAGNGDPASYAGQYGAYYTD